MPAERDAWLALTKEEALEPGLPICDPHHHFWDRPNDRFLLEDLLANTGAGHNITHTVFIECSEAYRTTGPEPMRPVGETEFVVRITEPNTRQRGKKTSVAAGIVGFADLTLGDAVTPVLEAHVEAGKGRFRGIRDSGAWDPGFVGYKNPPKGHFADPRFRQGMKRLQAMGLSFEAWHYHPQFPDAIDLAKAFPGLTIITNHVGGFLGTGPYAARREEEFQAWKRGVAELATCPNVVMKVGGLGMPRYGFGFESKPKPPTSEELAKAWAPFVLYCIEKFGPNRCMFESNFPVDQQSCSYVALWNAFKRISKGFSASERDALFRGTAMRAYRLDGDSAKRR